MPVCGWAGVLFASVYLLTIPVAVKPHGRLIKLDIKILESFFGSKCFENARRKEEFIGNYSPNIEPPKSNGFLV